MTRDKNNIEVDFQSPTSASHGFAFLKSPLSPRRRMGVMAGLLAAGFLCGSSEPVLAQSTTFTAGPLCAVQYKTCYPGSVRFVRAP